ncbi:MAG: succinate dehydrogenase/fumarate reductase cytochrome b subunit [Prevotellaceae bacterium]|jgi:succinate dehydrogenase / fumarate reductase cytochrome b subunit|nr:succinate dehydrogenase/fumarate reductase cytochrome b subunit [Prevotellaceae bacterium]
MSLFIFSSSVGRKLVMSISGVFLVLFLTFHMVMNLVALFSPEGYNLICKFLGANWYALVGTKILALGFLVHIVYAFVLYIQNRRARGSDAYAVTTRPKGVEWASKNMLVLGVAVFAFLGLHLYDFWAKMQLVEILHKLGYHVDSFAYEKATDGAYHIQNTFADPIHTGLYLIGLGALWFHLTHGFWSAFQSMGINNKTWFCRLKWIGYIYSTLLIGGFALVVVFYFAKANGIFAYLFYFQS